MKKTQTVVLEIQFDDEMCESPADWNWRELLDLGPDEEVQVLEVNGRPVLEKQNPDS